ncbi:MAG: YCII-related [Gammaproteobacteria bacterium]|nr:YCII-related [Gammaproteobacteria bacterium]
MLYAFMCEDTADSLEKRQRTRPQHLARLQALRDQGRLVLAGPFPAIDSPDPGPAGYSGSLIVAEFASLPEAQSWADAEPYLQAGIYKSILVKPFKQTLP